VPEDGGRGRLGGVAEDPDFAAPPEVAALLADLTAIGPFFAVGTGALPGQRWVPVGALGDPHGPLADRIEAVEAALFADFRGVETGPSRAVRVAASIAFQGIAAQIVAPLFAAVAVHGALPAAGAVGVARSLHWRPGGGGPWLWWPAGGRAVACPDPTALGALVTELLAPIVDAVRAQAAVAERVLWGNVASSVASARQLVAAGRPDAAPRAAAVGRHLLTTAPFAATASLRDPAPPDVGWTFQRRSCCLYYRVPVGGICGDCVLRRPVRRTHTAGDRSPPPV
jgi:hypothetical protein